MLLQEVTGLHVRRSWFMSRAMVLVVDMHGNVRVWDATQPTAVLKYTGRALSGTVRDLAWDGESQRILVGGDGKER